MAPGSRVWDPEPGSLWAQVKDVRVAWLWCTLVAKVCDLGHMGLLADSLGTQFQMQG